MAGALMLVIYLLAGLMVFRFLLPGKPVVIRIWLGLCAGMFLLMWLPALIAFLRPFDAAAQWLSLPLLAAVAGASYWFRDRRELKKFSAEDRRAITMLLVVALPLTIIGLYLQHTHILLPREGALMTGQATYGDLPLHLAITTSLQGARLPADYSILPGVRLGYPFLADSLSTTFLALGWGLRQAVIIPGTIMMALVFSGYVCLASRCCASRRAAVLGALLVFVNGGLGFLYSVDIAGVSLGSEGANQLQQGRWLDRLSTILNGFYQTPANHAEFTQYNLRMSNIVADMLLPQRTFLAGFMVLLPCLYLIADRMKGEKEELRPMVPLAVMAGGLPLIHTHSFLALGLASAGWFVYDAVKKKALKPWLFYGGIAAALSLPQLVLFTFPQSASGGFLRFQFNWVNNPGGTGLLDGYLWFYLKNIGLPFLLLIAALFEKNAWHRRLFAGAFVIFIAAEFVVFQPNEYDNNKLFYVWWALCAMPVADYAVTLWGRLKGLRARPFMAIIALLMLFLSGSLAIAREIKSEYQMFSREDVRVADFIREETPRGSRFVTGTQHINPVSSLAGREIVCGPDLWLYYHGFDTGERQNDLRAFYRDPAGHAGVPQKYGAEYILLGPYESQMGGSRETLDALYDKIYDHGGFTVYQVPQG